MELEKRLGLYQVFLKIYEHNRTLLDEILELENSTAQSPTGKTSAYIQGVVQNEQAYIITNLLDGITQQLLQPQGIWVIGRDRRLALPLRDRWLSRRHAAIQYVAREGFYLVDFNSTNGSFVNGEPVLQRQLLKDGDLIRLGSVAISFFVCQTAKMLEPVSPDILALSEATGVQMLGSDLEEDIPIADEKLKKTSSFLLKPKSITGELPVSSSLPPLTTSERSEILDRFFSRQMPVEQN